MIEPNGGTILGAIHVSTAVLAGSLLCHGEEPARYRLVQVVGASSFEERLNETAAAGYRVAAACFAPGKSLAAVLAKTDAGNYGYAVVDNSSTGKFLDNSSSNFRQRANELGAKGFQLRGIVPAELRRPSQGRTAVLTLYEKSPGDASAYEYELHPPFRTMRFKRRLQALVDRGYRMVDLSWFGEVVLENNGGAARPTASEKPYRLSSLRAKQGRIQVPEGYRLFGVRQRHSEGATIMMERVVSPDESEYVIRQPEFKAGLWHSGWRPGGTSEELNDLGAKGFQLRELLWAISLDGVPHVSVVMEKVPGALRTFQYRFLAGARMAELSAGLAAGAGEGYGVSGMRGIADGSKEDFAGVLLILEKTL